MLVTLGATVDESNSPFEKCALELKGLSIREIFTEKMGGRIFECKIELFLDQLKIV